MAEDQRARVAVGEQLARIADQVVLWLWVDAAPWVTASWKYLIANSQSLNHLALIAAGLIGIWLLWIRTRAADRQARTGEQGHITDRFTKAVEQLGSEKMAVRLGAIYALERLSKDSPDDHWTIMEVLTAYVRDNAPWPPNQAVGNPFVELQASNGDGREEEIRPATDIQAILTVLGRRDEEASKLDKAAGRCLDLSGTDLRRMSLRGASLQDTNFERANLNGARLVAANLPRANLRYATLKETNLRGADLKSAILRSRPQICHSKESRPSKRRPDGGKAPPCAPQRSDPQRH